MSFSALNEPQDAIERAVGVADEWLGELARERGDPDRIQAYRVLRATLHGLRDVVPVRAAMTFAAELPLLIRAMVYDGWDMRPRSHDAGCADEFLDRVAADAGLNATGADVEVEAVARLLAAHLPARACEELRDVLPGDLAPLFARLAGE